MIAHFIFIRKQRSSALLLTFNACVALLMYLAANKYLPDLTSDKNAIKQIFDILDIAIWFIEAILIGLAMWFWLENKQIRVCVTPTTLSYFDPTFGDVSWQVNISDITELKQVTDTRKEFFSNIIVLKNGGKVTAAGIKIFLVKSYQHRGRHNNRLHCDQFSAASRLQIGA